MVADLNIKNLTIDYTTGPHTNIATGQPTGVNSQINSPKNTKYDGITSLAVQIGSKSGMQMHATGHNGLYLDLRGNTFNPS